MVIGQYSILV